MDINKTIADIKDHSLRNKFQHIIPEFNPEKYLEKNYDIGELKSLLSMAEIKYYRELHGSYIMGFFKRIIRRLIRCCVFPCIEDISDFNRRSAMTIIYMSEDIGRLKKDIDKLQKEIENLRENE